MKRASIVLSVLVAVAVVANTACASVSFSWSGAPIAGEDPNYLPSGTAEFSIDDDVLTIVLTNTSTMQMGGLGEVLTGLTWDISAGGVELDPESVMVATGSSVVGTGATPDVDVSSEWAFRDDLALGNNAMGDPLGEFGVGSMGNANSQETFGPHDRFDTSTNLWGPASPNGAQGGIVSSVDDTNLQDPPFENKGPFVQNEVIMTFEIDDDDLDEDDIENVQALFGTNGMTTTMVTPEPATVVIWSLLGGLALGIGWWRRRS